MNNWGCSVGIQPKSPPKPKPVPIIQRLGITPNPSEKSCYSNKTPKEAKRKRKPPLSLKEKLLRITITEKDPQPESPPPTRSLF